MTWPMRIYKVSFLPVIGRDDKQQPTKVGRYMTYVTAPNVFGVAGVLRAFLPELYGEGHDIEEEVDVDRANKAWSVSVGPEGRTVSLLVVAPGEEAAEKALLQATSSLPILARYVAMKLWSGRTIDLTKEGIW
jgi:hypothetical protein